MFSNISDEFVGITQRWVIPGNYNDPLEFKGVFLGFSTSQTRSHNRFAHPNGELVPVTHPNGRSVRCSACRWSEFRLFKETGNESDEKWPYILHIQGKSSIPGENTRSKVHTDLTAPEVFEFLVTRRGNQVYFSVPAGRLLAQAAGIDLEFREFYSERRVP